MKQSEGDTWWNAFDGFAATAFPKPLDAPGLQIAHDAHRAGLSPSAAIVAVRTMLFAEVMANSPVMVSH